MCSEIVEKPADVGEEDREPAFLAAEPESSGVAREHVGDLVADVRAERAADEAALARLASRTDTRGPAIVAV
jgi:hypothetical protein